MYNESIRLAKQGLENDEVSSRVADDAALVKNSTQRVVAKALSAMENHRHHDDVGAPSHNKTGPYPLRANFEEGYTVFVRENGLIGFRISAKPYEHVTGVLRGADTHLDILEAALSGDRWEIGTAEALFTNGTPELHISVRSAESSPREKQDSETVVGVDVNEANVALTAFSQDGVEDTLVIEFPEIKFERHRYFTMRKRADRAGKSSVHATLQGREKRFVRDRLHKISRRVVEFVQQFEKPCIVFEDLKELRDGLDYGTRMNRRLHHIPFRALQFYTSYKTAFEGIPTAWVDPAYTSQRCPICSHTERANRRRKRFKCRSCGHQDHADRNASINVAAREIETHQDWNVAALNSLPQVRMVRRQASGAVDAPTATLATVRGSQADGREGVLE